MNQELFNFYIMGQKDIRGRSLCEMLGWNDAQLENVHDYIQWMFPTLTQSKCQGQSPVLDLETIKKLKWKRNEFFRVSFKKALKRMLTFWGIPFEDDGMDIIVKDIPWRPYQWAEYGDHNQLRMSRVIESCRLLGFESTAKSLFHELTRFAISGYLGHRLTAKNVAYWYQSYSGEQLFN
jgi:hypothetical protein